MNVEGDSADVLRSSTLTGKKRSRPDENHVGEVDNDTVHDAKRLKNNGHSKEDCSGNDERTDDMDVDIHNTDVAMAMTMTMPMATKPQVEESPMVKQMYPNVDMGDPTGGTKSTLAKIPGGTIGVDSTSSSSSMKIPGSISRPPPFSMRSSAMNDTMNGRDSEGDLLPVSLSSVQVKLNTKFSYNRPKPNISELVQNREEISPLMDPSLASTSDKQDVSPTNNGHNPKRITKVIRMTIEISPSTTTIFFAMIIMFLLNVLTTYLILDLSFSYNSQSDIVHRDPLRQIQLGAAILSNILATVGLSIWIAPWATVQTKRHHPHIIPPSHGEHDDDDDDGSSANYRRRRRHFDKLSNVTLRQFLSHEDGFHLALAPSFFGFYVYFGALTAFQENVLSEDDKDRGKRLLPVDLQLLDNTNESDRICLEQDDPLLRSVAGASAGAMAAVLLASGLNPRESAEFASSMTLNKFADFPGFGGFFKGDLFEKIMVQRLKRSRSNVDACATSEGSNSEFDDDGKGAGNNLLLEEGLIPVAVTGFDILSMKEKVLTKGCMGKAARASATFPGLFQPCHWRIHNDNDEIQRHLLIDGGIKDPHGLVGLQGLRPEEGNKRVVNLVAGKFGGWDGAVGPSQLPDGINASEVVSISIENAPQCGPWAMSNGPRAVEASMNALIDVLDAQMYHGNEEGHYILRIDANAFIPNQ